MIGLSSLQFKDIPSLGPAYFRIDDVNLPQRILKILAMQTAPDFVEIITWNYAGESHYVGNIRDESSPQPYSQSDEWAHAGWQSLASSFISAYKNGATDAGAMAPPSGDAVDAMWYNTTLNTSTCVQLPGVGPAVDAVNYAVVVDEGASGYQHSVLGSESQEQRRRKPAAPPV